jgi:hypothetical protein
MKTRIFLIAAALVAITSSSQAQNGAAADSAMVGPASDSSAVAHAAVPSVIDAPTAALHRRTAPLSAEAALAATHQNLGQAKALMVVGAAAFVAGALIDGDAGRIIMVGGAVIGLYGLYQYLQ